MRRRLVLLALALIGTGCGSSPAAPAISFPLTAGSYRLVLSGAQCLVFSTGPSAGVATSVDVTVTLAPSGSDWALSTPGHALTGLLSSNGMTMSGTLTGSATIQGTQFTTGATGTDTLVIGGSAPSNDRFKGMSTSGSVKFLLSTAAGDSMALCPSVNFSLRRAT